MKDKHLALKNSSVMLGLVSGYCIRNHPRNLRLQYKNHQANCLVCSGCHNEYHRLGSLNNRKFFVTVLEVQVQDQSAGRFGSW